MAHRYINTKLIACCVDVDEDVGNGEDTAEDEAESDSSERSDSGSEPGSLWADIQEEFAHEPR